MRDPLENLIAATSHMVYMALSAAIIVYAIEKECVIRRSN